LGQDGEVVPGAAIGREVVHGNPDRLPLFQLDDVLDEQGGFQRIRVIHVDDGAVGRGHVPDVFVVGVVGEIGDVFRADPLQNGVGDGRFAGPGAPSHADCNGRRAGGCRGHSAISK